MTEDSIFSLLSKELLSKLNSINIFEPTKVQSKVIPEIFAKKNVVFRSETGTGKTFAYLLPLISKLQSEIENAQKQQNSIKIIICAPTFELASQIKQEVLKVSDLKTSLFIGGTPIKRQIETLKEKPVIAAGTPARLTELIRLKKIKLDNLEAIIFDEADRLFKQELIEESSYLKNIVPENVQFIACSATLDKNIKNIFSFCTFIILPEEEILQKNISHWAIYAEQRDKIDTLRKFILAAKPSKAIVFTSRTDQVENIYNKLSYKKIECLAIHSKTEKKFRKENMNRFKSGKCNILITSDLAARGLDIKGISHIIQTDLPEEINFFIHRAGRTARAGQKGINTVIGDEYEMRRYASFEKKLSIKVFPKEIYSGKIINPFD